MINTVNNKKFETANIAYECIHDAIIQHGTEFGDTKALFNVGFYITNPLANAITNKERKWNIEYAEAEFQWYLTGGLLLGDLFQRLNAIMLPRA